MTLKELEIGKSAAIVSVGGEGALRQHFLDMGLIPGAEVTMVKLAPMGDPMELKIHGYELTLRLADAEKITVTALDKSGEAQDGVLADKADRKARRQGSVHPGLGEGGKYHVKADENPLPEGETLTFALAGNQNCGKTTFFNRLTGANQHVGNFPGVTVDRKDGVIRGHSNTLVTDLPGIYSMSPYSSEEIVTREFILSEKPKGIINIVDASNIERNLYLTLQLLELDIPMVVALNMMDEVRENGGSIRINEMEEALGVPVIPISAAKNEGIQEVIDHAIHVAKYQERPGRKDFCSGDDQGSAVHRCIHGIMHLIEDHAKKAGIPVRFAASKLAEGDELILEKLALDANEKEMLEHIILQMEKERGLDKAAAIADMRFRFIGKVCAETVVKPKESREHARSRMIDRILTGKYTAIPAFVGIMALVFWLTFGVIGKILADLLEMGIDALTGLVDSAMTAWKVNEVLHSLVIDGIFNGVGSVLSFLPIIVTLFFFLSLLEDSGYMARVAFVMDKLLRKIGLSGRSIVPMLIGFGCTVPGVMASRTLSSERDRKMTILLTPFMSCSAKLPIYAFFTAAFFPKHGTIVMVLLYFGGIAMGILMALLMKGSLFKGEPVPFVMELPNYRMPGAKNVAQLLWEKAKDFLQRAFTVIFVATIVIWFLQTFNLHFNIVSDAGDSILASVAGVIAPVFGPLGFGDWRISTALITGFMAKESVVSTLSVLIPSEGALLTLLSPVGAASLLVFCLLYTPCVAAVASIKRELGARWAVAVVIGQCVIAWVAAFLVHIILVFSGCEADQVSALTGSVSVGAAAEWTGGSRSRAEAMTKVILEPEIVEFTISAAGDVTLGNAQVQGYEGTFREMYDIRKDPGYFLGGVKSVFEADDMTIVNFEGTLTFSNDRVEKKFNMKGDPEYVSILGAGSVEAVSLGNNHHMDYGQKGHDDTVEALEGAGIRYAFDSKVGYYEAKGIEVGFVSVNEVYDGQKVETYLEDGITRLKAEGMDLVIACCHWGIETRHDTNAYQRELGRKCIDWGADLVLGHHPHVLQGIENYKGKYIVYSLGNFCFGGNTNPRDKDSMIFQQTFTFRNGKKQEDNNIRIIPCTISSVTSRNDYRPTIARGAEADRILELISTYSKEFE